RDGRGRHTRGGARVYPPGRGVAPSGQCAAPWGQWSAPSGQYPPPAVCGAGQRAFLPARSSTSVASVPAEMTPAAPSGEEVPPAPEVKESSATGARGGLLLPTPSGN